MDAPKTPGQLLRRLLDERGWTQEVLAAALDKSQPAVNHWLADKRPISADAALELEVVFKGSVTAEEILALQNGMELNAARYKADVDTTLGDKAELLAALPIPEMIKRGWIDAEGVKDFEAVVAGVLKLFGANSQSEILRALPHSAKKTGPLDPTTPVQLAWLHRARNLAAKQLVARPYTPRLLAEALEKLDRLLGGAPEVRHVPRIMAEAGIRFVIVECLSRAKFDGATMWLGPNAPVVVMSLRADRIDNFWFVLRHELAHVEHGHGQPVGGEDPTSSAMVDSDAELSGKAVADEERVANAAASAFCVPTKEMDSFILRKAPIYRERDMLGFAARLKLHPGIVAGQLRHRLDRWDLFSKHLVKIRHEVTPGATVDGWGDIAPDGEHAHE